MRPIRITVLAAAALLVGGCGPEPCPGPETVWPFRSLVGRYNRNAAQVPYLWARAKIAITVPTDLGIDYTWGSTSELASPNGILMLFKGENPLGPHDFVLVGLESGETVFRLGSSTADNAYYYWINMGDESELRWGRIDLAGAPRIAEMPLDPLQVLAVLGVCELPDDFTQPPTILLDMDETPGRCAYVVSYIARQPITNHLLFRRQMRFGWKRYGGRRLEGIRLLDNQGRTAMDATVGQYEPIQLADASKPSEAPTMPTRIDLRFARSDAKIRIALSEMTIDPNRGMVEACKLWSTLPDSITRRIQVDRQAERYLQR